MENRNEVREFLASRRAKVTPEKAGVPLHGKRRVPGLHCREVAVLAGVSTECTIGARPSIRMTGQGPPT